MTIVQIFFCSLILVKKSVESEGGRIFQRECLLFRKKNFYSHDQDNHFRNLYK